MDYMLDKINLLDNKDEIINAADQLVNNLKNIKDLSDSEKLMVMELALAKFNHEIFK